MNEKINKYIIGGIVCVVVLAAGVAIGVLVARKGTPTGTNTYQAGWDAAKKRLADTGFFPMVNGEMKNVLGTVQELQGNGMTVKISPLEPLADPAMDVRTVKFDANTKFYLLKQKDQAVYQKEVSEFNQAMQQAFSQAGKQKTVTTPVMPGTPPQPFVRVEINAGDIKTGAQVSVTTANDIRNMKEFVAVEVTEQEGIIGGNIPAAGAALPMPPIPAR